MQIRSLCECDSSASCCGCISVRGGPLRIQISAGDQAAKGSWLSVKRKRKRWLHKYAHLPPAAAASAVPARLSLRPSVRLCVRPAPGEAEMRRDGSAGLHEGGSGLSAQRRCRSPPSRYAGTPLPGCNARAALRGKRGKSGAERQRCRERPGYGSGRGTGEPSSRNNNTAAPQNVEIHGEPWRWEWRESRSSSGQSYHKHIVYPLPSALCCFLHAKHYRRILQIEMCKKRSRAWGEGGGLGSLFLLQQPEMPIPTSAFMAQMPVAIPELRSQTQQSPQSSITRARTRRSAQLEKANDFTGKDKYRTVANAYALHAELHGGRAAVRSRKAAPHSTPGACRRAPGQGTPSEPSFRAPAARVEEDLDIINLSSHCFGVGVPQCRAAFLPITAPLD